MKPKNATRWNAIRAHRIDDENSARPFSIRLAEENGWSPEYAGRTIEEYRRFVYLAAVCGEEVTPSVAVDEVWHLHLAYTRDYWGPFADAVGRPLHHGPSPGGTDADEHYEDRYEATFEAYRREFGSEPPEDIWPPASVRFSPHGQFVKLSPEAIGVLRSMVRASEATGVGVVVWLGALPFVLSIAFAVMLMAGMGSGDVSTVASMAFVSLVLAAASAGVFSASRITERLGMPSVPSHLVGPLSLAVLTPYVPRNRRDGSSSGSSCSTGLGDSSSCGSGCGGGGCS